MSVIGLALVISCRTTLPLNESRPSQRDINAVLADHQDDLMSLPGVVGVYVGLLKDGKTECLKVMLAHKDRTLENSIPRMLEGYQVVSEVTGESKPMKR